MMGVEDTLANNPTAVVRVVRRATMGFCNTTGYFTLRSFNGKNMRPQSARAARKRGSPTHRTKQQHTERKTRWPFCPLSLARRGPCPSALAQLWLSRPPLVPLHDPAPTTNRPCGVCSNKQSKQELEAGLQQQQQMLMQQKAMMQQQQTAGAQRKPFGDVGNQNKAPQQQAAAPMHTKKLEPMGFRAAPMMDNGPAPVDTAGAQPVVDYTCKPATSPLMEATCKLSDFGGELDERVQSLHDVHGHLIPHAVKVCPGPLCYCSVCASPQPQTDLTACLSLRAFRISSSNRSRST